MSSEALISVIIPTYNRAPLIGNAIHSVLIQDYAAYEIIVVDDGSTDDTETVIQSFDAPIRYFKRSNHGIASTRNYGIQQAQGEYIAFLDSDDVFLPGKLRKQMQVFRDDPELALVYTGYTRINQSTDQEEYCPPNAKMDHELMMAYVIATPTVMVRASVFQQVQPFNEDFKIGEDIELWVRIIKCCKITAIDEPLVNVYTHGQNITRNAWHTFQHNLNLLRHIEQTNPHIPYQVIRDRYADIYLDFLLKVYQGWPQLPDGYSRRQALKDIAQTIRHKPGSFKRPLILGLIVRLMLPQDLYLFFRNLWRPLLRIETKG